MKRKFVVTQNVKRFVDLMDTLQNAPANLPKMALVYGDFGLGKSQTIMWWVTNNDAVYVRCNHKMSARWLLTEIVEELDEIPAYLTSLLFKQIEDKLRERPRVLVVDEVDFLLNNSSAIETVRDLHDKIGIPVVLVGMSMAEAKLKRHKHIYDRLLGQALRKNIAESASTTRATSLSPSRREGPRDPVSLGEGTRPNTSMRTSTITICAASSATRTTSKATRCLMMS